jgi:hypothetical protein
VLLGNGDGTFASAQSYSAGVANPATLAINDFNGDGFTDIATANSSSNDVSILINNGSGIFSSPTNFSVGTNPKSITSADFNGDQILDLAIANTNSINISILTGNGNGNFSSAVNLTTDSFPYAITNADFNGETQFGIGYYQVTQKVGERWSVAYRSRLASTRIIDGLRPRRAR